MQEFVLFILRIGFLVLLWLFVLAAVLVVRGDLFGARAPKAAPRRSAQPAAPAQPKRRDKSAARKLVITEGPLAGTTLPLSGEPVTIGRADDSTLVLTDDYVSSRHARLVPRSGAWVVEDMGSTNGTYLGRNRVTEPTPVPLGAPVRVGKTVLELRK